MFDIFNQEHQLRNYVAVASSSLSDAKKADTRTLHLSQLRHRTE